MTFLNYLKPAFGILTCLTSLTAFGVCDRSPEVVAQIIKKTKIASCGLVNAYDLSRIESMDISTSVKPGDFDGLKNLKGLKLLGEAHPGIFRDLKSLKELQVAPGAFLEADTFEGLLNLEELVVFGWPSTFGTGHSEIKAGAFSGLPKLKRLTIKGSDLRKIEAGAFENLSALEELNIDLTLLTTLDEKVFEGLSSLRTLDLSRNPFSEIPGKLLQPLIALENFSLSTSALTTIPEELFSNNKNLKRLNLSNGSIKEIPSKLLRGLYSLKLFIFSNYSSGELEVPSDLFENNLNLNYLALGKNVNKMSVEAVKNLNSLEFLSLYQNDKLKMSKDELQALSKLPALKQIALPCSIDKAITEEVLGRKARRADSRNNECW